MSIWLFIKIFFSYLILRLKVAWDSIFTRSTIARRYIRAYYSILINQLKVYNRPGLKAIEFGGSTQIIKNILSEVDYQIAPNFPEVDIQNLEDYSSEEYDLVILDNVLEHVENPFKAIQEIHRILKPGGTLLAIVPFLIYIHPTPDDYWRFTESGIRKLCENFSEVKIYYWGNRVAAGLINKYGFDLTIKQARFLLGFSLRNEKAYPVNYWFFAKK